MLVLLASAACQPGAPAVTPTLKMAGTPSSTRQTASSVTPSVAGMDLKGIGIQVWHPWYGAEASLIDSQVAEFNQQERLGNHRSH